MKRIIFSILTAGLFAATGYAQESQPKLGGAEKFAAGSKDLVQDATAKAAEVAQKTDAMSKQASAAMAKAEDVMQNLNLSLDDIKAKVASLDKDQLLAYAQSYKKLFAENEALIAKTKAGLKDLSWYKRLGSEGKALKAKLSGHTTQLSTLKEQYSVYTDKLKALGVDLSAYGL